MSENTEKLTINKNQAHINRVNMNRYTRLKELIEKDIKFYQGQERYKDKDMRRIIEQAYDSGDPKKFLLKNYNIVFGGKYEGGIGPTPAGVLEKLPVLRGFPSGDIHPEIFRNMEEAANLKKEIDKQLGIISGNTPGKLNKHGKVPIRGFEKNNVHDGVFLKPSDYKGENKEMATDLLLKIRGIR